MIGRQGSGKGTQAKLLQSETDYSIFSTGGRFREIAAEPTFVGKKIKDIIDNGWLTPHWFASYLFQDVLFKLKEGDGIIFEGVARKEPEARLFHEVHQWLERDYCVLYINISEDKAVKRLQKRSELEGREDDDEDGIRKRFQEYEKHTLPALEFLRSQNVVIDIDGEQSLEDVHKESLEKLKAFKK